MKKIFFFSLLILLTTMAIQAQNRSKIIYIGDPMCSWCYGIAPQLVEVKAHFKGEVDFELVMGGLRPNGTETMADLSDFLKHHWQDVNKRSGQKFNYNILNQSDFVYNTEPACRAVLCMKNQQENLELEFMKEVQTMFYLDNKWTNKVESYKAIIEKFNLDYAKFKADFESETMRNATEAEFMKARRLGVNSFPTILLQTDNNTTVIASSFATADEMIKRIEKKLRRL